MEITSYQVTSAGSDTVKLRIQGEFPVNAMKEPVFLNQMSQEFNPPPGSMETSGVKAASEKSISSVLKPFPKLTEESISHAAKFRVNYILRKNRINLSAFHT